MPCVYQQNFCTNVLYYHVLYIKLLEHILKCTNTTSTIILLAHYSR